VIEACLAVAADDLLRNGGRRHVVWRTSTGLGARIERSPVFSLAIHRLLKPA